MALLWHLVVLGQPSHGWHIDRLVGSVAISVGIGVLIGSVLQSSALQPALPRCCQHLAQASYERAASDVRKDIVRDRLG